MLVLSWNIRGLGRKDKRRVVRNLVKEIKPTVLFLQETKLDFFDRSIVSSLGGGWLSKGMGMESQGSAGGVISLWNEDHFSVMANINNSRCIIIAGQLLKIKKCMVFCNVYAANTEKDHKELWNFILQAQNSLHFPWCIGGDFNTVLNPSERRGSVCNMGSIKNFNSFILQAKVVDLPIRGSRFTWSNNREEASWAHLDRFLLSPEFFSWFLNLLQTTIPRTVSDHCAITLGEPREDWGPSPFRIYNSWLEDGDLMNQAKEGWQGCKTRGSIGFVLASKMRASKRAIKIFLPNRIRESFSLKEFEGRLLEVDKKAVFEGWTDVFRQERLCIMGEMWKGVRRDEQMWCQKSRVQWLKEGDKNTKFFHCLANGRRRTNFIGEITLDGRKVTRPYEVKEEIAEFFKSHYSKKNDFRPDISGLDLKRLSDLEIEMLEN